MQCFISILSICHKSVSRPTAPCVQGLSNKHTFEDVWAELMKLILVCCGNWMIKKSRSQSYYWTAEWSVVSSFVKFSYLMINLEGLVNNNNIPWLLSTIVHPILVGLTESKSLLFLFWPLVRRCHGVSDRCGVDWSRFQERSSQAFCELQLILSVNHSTFAFWARITLYPPSCQILYHLPHVDGAIEMRFLHWELCDPLLLYPHIA